MRCLNVQPSLALFLCGEVIDKYDKVAHQHTLHDKQPQCRFILKVHLYVLAVCTLNQFPVKSNLQVYEFCSGVGDIHIVTVMDVKSPHTKHSVTGEWRHTAVDIYLSDMVG